MTVPLDVAPSPTPYPLVYGYVRSSLDRPNYVADCQEAIRQWCAREGWMVGAIFTDVGAALDSTDRLGFRGLLDALHLPQAAGAVILSAAHLSSRTDIAVNLVRQIRATGSAVMVRDGDLPDEAQRLCTGQSELTR